MLEVDKPSDLQQHAGQDLGFSAWLTITQEMIYDFARLSGDDNWIHVDQERARRELPDGKTIAHGWLTLSFITGLSKGMINVRQRGKGINYGSERVRFIEPVQCGDRIRLHRKLMEVSSQGNYWKLVYDNTIEIEGKARPAMSATTISLIFNPS